MLFKDDDKTVIYENGNSTGYFLGKNENLDFVFLEIARYNEISKHSLDVPVSFYIISGSGQCEIDSNIFEVSEGDVLTVEPNLMRSWKNVTYLPLKILVVKEKKQQ